MLLSLVDALRCPANHEAHPLVLSAESWANGRVLTGLLGCPLCHARYPIHSGVADFTGVAGRREDTPSPRRITAADGMRLAAQLDLVEGDGLVLLTAGYATHAAALSHMANAICLLVTSTLVVPEAELAIAIRILDRIPLIDGSLRAAAVDDVRGTPAFLGEAGRCVRNGGRIVAPADSLPPPGVRLLARDDREWVGQVERLTSIVTPRRAIPR